MGYRIAADVVLVLHAAFIAFVVVGLALILLGGILRWRWVHHRWFRVAHLGAIAMVVAQAWLGIACPLTTLENHYRYLAGETAYPGGFIAYWLHQVIFFQAADWVFIVGYTAFGLLVLAALWFVPVRWLPARP